MAKRKNANILEGIGKAPESKLTVQKSRPLTALWQSDLSLSEFKILDTYLARINSGDTSKRTILLTKGELETALGVTRINKDDLHQRLKNLYQPIDLAKGDDKRLHLVSLFQEAKAEQDGYGVWQIQLTCTDAAMKYFFNVEKLGYLRYKLRSITSLTSRYTYILFIYLEANRYRESWEVDLDELKQTLNCHEDELYREFKRFNERILKRAQSELAEKTECRFTYEPVRRGRSVAAIRFTLEMLSPKLEAEIQGKDPNQITVFDPAITEEEATRRQEMRDARYDNIGPGFENEIFDEFSDVELKELKELAFKCADPDDVKEHKRHLDPGAAASQATATFLEKKIRAMNVYDQRNPVGNRYNYVKKAVLNELKNQK